ncbi:hypothetical protein NK983_31360, partial [Salmonella enterica subsp. enterica serovar Typhimurium]|nr:hypothetical protein [Salmonella enterica subsp. enterica serovar Typhimurium]
VICTIRTAITATTTVRCRSPDAPAQPAAAIMQAGLEDCVAINVLSSSRRRVAFAGAIHAGGTARLADRPSFADLTHQGALPALRG